MSGFKADAAVAKLEFDLRPYVDAHGILPEPSSEAVMALTQAIASVSPNGFQGLIEMEEQARAQALEDAKDAFLGVLGGVVTEDHLNELPFRPGQAFMAWVVQSLMDPTQWAPVTKPNRAARRAGAGTTS